MCGGLALFQISSNSKFSKEYKTISQIRSGLKIGEEDNTDLMQLMEYLVNNDFKAMLYVVKNSFGKKGLLQDLKNIGKRKLYPKQYRYINILKNCLLNNRVKEISEITEKIIDNILDKGSVLIVNVSAKIFSDGKFFGQHTVLIHGKDKNSYIFTGERELKKQKTKFIEAMNNIKIKSFIEVEQHDR